MAGLRAEYGKCLPEIAVGLPDILGVGPFPRCADTRSDVLALLQADKGIPALGGGEMSQPLSLDKRDISSADHFPNIEVGGLDFLRQTQLPFRQFKLDGDCFSYSSFGGKFSAHRTCPFDLSGLFEFFFDGDGCADLTYFIGYDCSLVVRGIHA